VPKPYEILSACGKLWSKSKLPLQKKEDKVDRENNIHFRLLLCGEKSKKIPLETLCSMTYYDFYIIFLILILQ